MYDTLLCFAPAKYLLQGSKQPSKFHPFIHFYLVRYASENPQIISSYFAGYE